MTPASDGSVVDGSACRGIVMLADGSPAWLDGLVAACVMAVSRVWVGAHCRREAAACRLTATWLRPLLTPS